MTRKDQFRPQENAKELKIKSFSNELPLSEELEKLMQHVLRSSRLNPYGRQKLLAEFLNKPEEPAKPRKYTQDWPAYNKAQMREKIALFFILDELLSSVPFPERKPSIKGRKPISLRDQIFYMALQSYNIKSSRRCIADLELCRQLGFIEKTPHFNTVLKCLNNPNNSIYLKHLVTISGLPLQQIESDFAVDSSGFSTSQFDRWFDVRFDKKKETDIRRFRKCHITCGVKTNIITAVNITTGYSGDSPEFPELVKTTRKIFPIREVSADKAYSSRDNLQAVSDLGGIAFIPFKSNATGRSKGTSIWHTMYDYFRYYRNDFLKHYHKRSNVETCFHMLKMKFGKHLRSKNEIGQDNEILAKCLAHNICVLVQEMFELGISISFEKCMEVENEST